MPQQKSSRLRQGAGVAHLSFGARGGPGRHGRFEEANLMPLPGATGRWAVPSPFSTRRVELTDRNFVDLCS